MLVLASPEITFADFGADLLTNVSDFARWLVDLLKRLSM
jgi:hypothetical protein